MADHRKDWIKGTFRVQFLCGMLALLLLSCQVDAPDGSTADID